jgi:hypothetical protein
MLRRVIDKKPGTPAPWGGGVLALFLSLTADSIAKSNVLKGSARRDGPFCATCDIIHRRWRCAYLRLMAQIPPGSPCGLRQERDNPLNAFRKRFGRIGQETEDRSPAGGADRPFFDDWGDGSLYLRCRRTIADCR